MPHSTSHFQHSLPETRAAASHDFTLAHQLSTELRAVQCQVNIKVDSVKSSLRRVHALKVLFEILARQIRRECNDFLDACKPVSGDWAVSYWGKANLRGSLVYSGQTSSSQAKRTSSYISVAPGATCRKNETLTGSPFLTF